MRSGVCSDQGGSRWYSTSAQWEVSHCLKNPCQWINDGLMKTCSRYSFNVSNNEISEIIQLERKKLQGGKKMQESEFESCWDGGLNPSHSGRNTRGCRAQLDCLGSGLHSSFVETCFSGLSGTSRWQQRLGLHIVSVKPLLYIYIRVLCLSWTRYVQNRSLWVTAEDSDLIQVHSEGRWRCEEPRQDKWDHKKLNLLLWVD